jgi:hypothetical protein
MSLPGFTAEVSLHRTLAHYFLSANSQQMIGAINTVAMNSQIQPAACNDDCYAQCQDSCIEGSGCLEMIGNGKGACLRRCARSCGSACGCNFF